MLSDIRETIELLANDESASQTERDHARRLLSRMDADSPDHCSADDICDLRVMFTGTEWEIEQKASRVASALSGMGVILYHDQSGYSLVGRSGSVSAVSRVIDDAQSLEHDDWDERMRVAWMSRIIHMVCDHDSMSLTSTSMSDIIRWLRSRGMSADPVHPRVSRDYVRHERRAEQLARILQER